MAGFEPALDGACPGRGHQPHPGRVAQGAGSVGQDAVLEVRGDNLVDDVGRGVLGGQGLFVGVVAGGRCGCVGCPATAHAPPLLPSSHSLTFCCCGAIPCCRPTASVVVVSTMVRAAVFFFWVVLQGCVEGACGGGIVHGWVWKQGQGQAMAGSTRVGKGHALACVWRRWWVGWAVVGVGGVCGCVRFSKKFSSSSRVGVEVMAKSAGGFRHSGLSGRRAGQVAWTLCKRRGDIGGPGEQRAEEKKDLIVLGWWLAFFFSHHAARTHSTDVPPNEGQASQQARQGSAPQSIGGGGNTKHLI